MYKKSIKFYGAIMALCLPFVATGHGAELSLKDAVNQATSSNSSLAGMFSRAQAMAEIPAQAGSLPDPVLSLNAMNLPMDSFSATQENMTQMQIGLSQALPFPGKLGLRQEAASFEAQAAILDADEMRLALIRNVQMSWWNLFFIDRAVSIVERNQQLLRQLIQVAETKYKTGQGLQSDVLLAQVELSRLLNVEISLKASRHIQLAQMNALLNRPAKAEVELPQSVDETLPANPDKSSLLNRALQSRPTLASQHHILQAAQTRIALAKKDYYPDFKLATTYGSRSGFNPASRTSRADFASIKLSMTLPFFTSDKQDGALAQRKAEAARQTFTLQDKRTQVDSEIEQALAAYAASYEQALLFKTGIIPQASQTVASMLAAYQVNKVDFLNLVRAQMTLYNYETQYWKALSSGWQAWARLEAAVGVPIAKGANDE
jgi:outer membrane protein TolC